MDLGLACREGGREGEREGGRERERDFQVFSLSVLVLHSKFMGHETKQLLMSLVSETSFGHAARKPRLGYVIT